VIESRESTNEGRWNEGGRPEEDRGTDGLRVTLVAASCTAVLRDGDEVVATLESRGSFNPTSSFASPDGRWEVRRAGFWGLRTVILAEDSSAEVAMLFRSAWRAGGRRS